MFGSASLGFVRRDRNVLILVMLGAFRWWSPETVAVVTGANRGIGFEIARQLAGHGLTVVLTARDAPVGLEAAKVLQEGGLNVDFHQLDILDSLSVSSFGEWIKERYGFMDILVSFLMVFLFLVCFNSTLHFMII